MTINDAGKRLSITDSLSNLGNKLTRVLSSTGSDTSSIRSKESVDRSQSRGRPSYASSGRGGAGNIRSVSRNPDASATLSPTAEAVEDDASNPRGREVGVSAKAMSSGRGGVGNIRPPNANSSSPVTHVPAGAARSVSRSASRPAGGAGVGPDAYEKEVLAKRMAEAQSEVRSSGRGGAGNMVASRSRSRGPDISQSPGPARRVPPAAIHSGRGGAGNVIVNLPIYEDSKLSTEKTPE